MIPDGTAAERRSLVRDLVGVLSAVLAFCRSQRDAGNSVALGWTSVGLAIRRRSCCRSTLWGRPGTCARPSNPRRPLTRSEADSANSLGLHVEFATLAVAASHSSAEPPSSHNPPAGDVADLQPQGLYPRPAVWARRRSVPPQLLAQLRSLRRAVVEEPGAHHDLARRRHPTIVDCADPRTLVLLIPAPEDVILQPAVVAEAIIDPGLQTSASR